ncbi:MAG: hypothetical protein ABSA46_18200 [Thermodesulfovibrionales bacterium]
MQYFYSVTDGGKTPYVDADIGNLCQQFTAIKTQGKTSAPNETMTDGLLQVARYKIIPNYSPKPFRLPAGRFR